MILIRVFGFMYTYHNVIVEGNRIGYHIAGVMLE